MSSLLRKEACSGSIHDLAYTPIQNCLADCLTEASAKAVNLTTAVQTGNLLDVDIHPGFTTLMEHKAFLSTWCKTFLHIREKKVFFLEHPQDLSCTNLPGRTISGDVCWDSADKGAKKLNTRAADFDDSTDVDGEKHSQSNLHPGFHRGNG